MRKARFQIVFSLCAAAAMWIVGTLAASAQNQPAGPYKPVAITPPAPVSDPAFEAMRQQLGEVAQRKDRAALSALVVAKGFFWERENGDRADKRKSGADNLAVALGLNNKGGVGWEILFSFTDDPTASASPEHKGAICAPAEPGYDAKAFDELLKATQSDESEWSYPVAAGTEVRATPTANAPMIEKLGLAFVHVSPDNKPTPASYLRVITPSGKAGYVLADAIAPASNDQLCYVKDGGAWKIGGYVGGGEPD
jgi:hypothetical protein